MKNNYELIIFDLDGTLIDTLKDLNASVNYALTLNGYPNRNLEHTRLSIGDGVAMLIKRSVPEYLGDNQYRKTLDDFEAYYHIHSSDYTTAYAGMRDTIEYLKAKGYKLAVSTNKIEDVAVSLIHRFYGNLFDTICGDNKIRAKKPAPDSINEIMKRLGITDKSKIVYIGDTEVDHRTADNAGVDSLIVTYGYRKQFELDKYAFDNVCIHSPEDIKRYL